MKLRIYREKYKIESMRKTKFNLKYKEVTKTIQTRISIWEKYSWL
jgi:hypothetical protein